MADLRLAFQIDHTKEPENSWRPAGTIEATQAGAGSYRNTITVPTAGVNVSFGNVAPGLITLYNLDDTNSVNYGEDDAGTVKGPGILYPTTRWPGMFHLRPGKTLRLEANVAACSVYIIAYTL